MWGREILFLSLVAGGIITSLVMILVYLIIRKAIENRRNAEIEKQKMTFSEPLFSFLMTGELNLGLIPDTSAKKQAIEQLLSRYAEVLEGESEKKNLYVIAGVYLSDYYRVGLRSRNWSKRMNALYHIEDFQIRSLESNVRAIISRKKVTKDEEVIGLRILALFQYESLFEELVIQHTALSEFEYRNILLKASDQALDEFVLGFQQGQPPIQKAILDILAIKKDLKYISFIETIFQSYSDEIRLRALKTLASIGYVNDISQYLPLCKSEKWQERMMVARLLGVMQEEEGVKCLVDLMHDSSWWVRSQAAHAIRNYPNGMKRLINVYQTSKDPFAIDLAWEWINKGD
jgi:hypothetical protein